MAIVDLPRPILVLLPSPLIRAQSYWPLARALSPFFRVHVPEMPETGGNRSAKKVWTVEGYAEWVKAEMDRMRINQAIVVGHSNSGAIAMRFATIYPERVLALVLADTIGMKKQSALRALVARIFDSAIEFRMSFQFSLHLLGNFWNHPRNFLAQLKLVRQKSSAIDLSKIRSPTLIAWGKRDHTVPLSIAWRLQHQLRRAELYVSKKGSHDWILTQPNEFVIAIMRWIKRQNMYQIENSPS